MKFVFSSLCICICMQTMMKKKNVIIIENDIMFELIMNFSL